MPFGLVNAPSTFSRIRRKLLQGLKNLRNYLDDVLGHTGCWFDHPNILREFFSRVREVNLALKPSKCFIGYTNLVFLGHKLGQGSLSPNDDLISKIRQAPSPTTKKQLRSFLGLIGYYRAFVTNFAAIAVPLTDLTKKGTSEKLIWTEAQEQAFQTRRIMCVFSLFCVCQTCLNLSLSRQMRLQMKLVLYCCRRTIRRNSLWLLPAKVAAQREELFNYREGGSSDSVGNPEVPELPTGYSFISGNRSSPSPILWQS